MYSLRSYGFGTFLASALVACALFFVFLTSSAYAQGGAGIGISPSLIERQAEPGEVLSEAITIRNLGDTEETYFLYTRDISSVTESGRPLYADEDLPPTGFEMSSWIKLPIENVTIAPGQERNVSFTIEVPEDTTPCSHFGAVFASVLPPDQVDLGASVGFQVANIVSIRVAGDCVESAVLRSFSTDKFLYSTKDVTFKAFVENKGSVALRPTGPIEVYNMLGSKVAQLTINEARNGLFPSMSREYELLWKEDSLGFGRYSANIGLVYGVQGQSQSTISGGTTFWILPWEIIQPFVISLAVLFLVSYFVIRRIVTRQVRQLSGGRRLVRQTSTSEPSIFILASISMLVVSAFALFILLLLFA